MNILPYKLETTNDQLTSRAGLLIVTQLMDQMQLSAHIDKHFPQPQSNRGFPPSAFIQTLMLMHHEGSFHLDDVRHISDDSALRTVLNLKQVQQASTLGAWLRKMGNDPAWTAVNRVLLKSALHRRKGVTLDIDATETISHKADAQWTYKKHKGY